MNWDVTGDGKTSLKAFFGIFGDTMGADFAATYNPNAEVTTRYRWSGPCVVDAAHERVLQYAQHQLRLPAGKRRFQYGPEQGLHQRDRGVQQRPESGPQAEQERMRPRCGSTGNWCRTSAVGFGYIYQQARQLVRHLRRRQHRQRRECGAAVRSLERAGCVDGSI